MDIKYGLALLCSGAVALSGCGMDTTPAPEEDTETRTGIALTMDVGSVAGVSSFQFNIETCDGQEMVSEQVSLSELEFDEEFGLDLEGSVVFADYFATLEAGCYDVELTPLDEEGDAVAHCSIATAQDVQVEAGQTTEIVMISRCFAETGGLDVLGVLAYAPTITKLEYDPSKFVGCDSLQVCATAIDPDDDGVEFVWEQLEGPTPAVGAEVVSSTDDNGLTTECIEMTPGTTGAFLFEVTVYDLIEGPDGDLVRVDDLAEDIDEEFPTSASLAFPVYAACDEEVLGEVEDPKKDEKYDHEEEVLGEVEDPKKEKKYDHDEEVLGEVEKDDPEDVLEEIEEPKKKKKKNGEKKYEHEEEVLGEVEEEEKKKDYEPEEVLEEIEEEKKKKDYEPEEVLEEIEEEKKKKDEPEEVLAEVEEEEKKKKDYEPEDVLEEIEEDDDDDDDDDDDKDDYDMH